MMRAVLLVAALAGLGIIVGCGGSEPTTSAPTPTTVAPAVSAPTAPPPAAQLDDYEYELDVLVDAEPDEGPPPLRVQFTGEIDEEGGPFTFAWDFGDGNKSSDQNPTHTYAKLGEYTAVLEVSDPEGNKGSDEIDIFVEELD